MKGIIDRLTADLRWRLGKSPKKFRPKRKEHASWGGFSIPSLAPLLLWGAYFTYALMGAPGLGQYFQGWEWLSLLLFQWPGWIISWLVIHSAARSINNWFLVKAYSRLLDQSERFTLVEYYKYLGRQAERAKDNPALGGPAEVVRLRQLQAKLRALLEKGIGKDTRPIESTLSEEAEFAEAVVEAYQELSADPLKQLDERLPGELRQQLEELDQEVERRREATLE
jgi:hypothetical protein